MKTRLLQWFLMSVILVNTLQAQEKILLSGQDYSRIKVIGNTKIYLIQSDSNKVTVSPANVKVENIKLNIKDSILQIESKGLPENFKIYVHSPNFKVLESNGAAEIKIDGEINGDFLQIINSGASELSGKVIFNNIIIKSSGASDINLSGETDSIKVIISGASDLKAFDLVSKKAFIQASGASDVQINCDSSLIGYISGTSSIKYLKEPALINIETSGNATEAVSKTSWVDVTNELGIQEKGDTIRLKMNGKELVIIEKDGETKVLKKDIVSAKSKKKSKFKGNWVGMEIGVNGYLNNQNTLDLPANYSFMDLNYPKSINFNINFFQQSVPIISNKFGLVTGLGFQWNNYRFSNNTTTLTTSGDSLGGYYNQIVGRDYQKSKLTTTYLTLPILLEFQTNKKHKSNSFHISAGVIGGLNINAHTKQVYSFDGTGKNKPKVWDHYYIQPFKLDATMRIGWGPLNLYATYGLMPLFRNDKGPELYPFSVGFVFPWS